MCGKWNGIEQLKGFSKINLREKERWEDRLRWLDGVEEDLRQLKVKRWKWKTFNREEWAVVIKETKVLREP